MVGTTEPKVEQRNEQQYVAIRTEVPITKLSKAVRQLLIETAAWLDKRGINPPGPPFVRYNVIDMAALMDLEIGFPVSTPLAGDDRVRPGVLPAGRYASLVYTNVRRGIEANGALINWIASNGLVMDRWDTDKGDAFRSRVEFFLTDPADEPDKKKWDTEVAIKLADAQPL